MNTEDTNVMEIVTFRLKADADPVAFRNAAKAVDTLLHARGTAVSRALVVDDDGLWTDIVEWTSIAEAKAAAEELGQRPGIWALWRDDRRRNCSDAPRSRAAPDGVGIASHRPLV